MEGDFDLVERRAHTTTGPDSTGNTLKFTRIKETFVAVTRDPALEERQRQAAAEAKRREQALLTKLAALEARAKRLETARQRKLSVVEAKRLEQERLIKLEEAKARRIEAELKRKLAAAEAKRLEQIRQRKLAADESRRKEQDRLRKIAEAKARRLEAERQRKLAAAAEARRKEQLRLRKIAEAKAKRERQRFLMLSQAGKTYIGMVKGFLVANPATPSLLDIAMGTANLKSALATGKASAIKPALASLQEVLAREPAFKKHLERKEQARLRKIAEAKRKEQARLRKIAEEKRRQSARKVTNLQGDLKGYHEFLKRQVVQNIGVNMSLVQTLVPVVKSLEAGLSSKKLSILQAYKTKIVTVMKKHGLFGQYAQNEKKLAARPVVRKKAATKVRGKKLAARPAVRKKAATKVRGKKLAALLARRQEKVRDAVAVIIGNRSYANRVPAVSYAHNDAEAMRKHVIKTLGYRPGNVIFIKDATQSQLVAIFGSRETHRGRLFSYVRPDESDVTVFYSGHGVPGLKDRRGYLLPVDADPNLVELNGYPIDLMYRNLQKLRAKTVRVYMDACFSGDSPDGMLVRATSGITIKTRFRQTMGKMIVVTAAQGNQFASWDEEARHGLFTKHLLEALQGKADTRRYGNNDGRITVGEIKNYLDREMTYQARRRYNRDQVASVHGDRNTVLINYR